MRKTFLSLLLGATLMVVAVQALPVKQVALTFDDGPTPGVTDKILDILKKEKVSATFFVIGRKVAQSPELARRMTAEGHEIGNHTYYHSRLDWLNDDKLGIELSKTDQLISEITGQPVTLFRPPHGRLTPDKKKYLKGSGYRTVLWGVNADDCWRKGRGIRSPVSITNRIMGRVQPGSIVLMHDNSRQIVEAVPLIIKRLKAGQYLPVTVSQLKRPPRLDLAAQKPKIVPQ